MFQNKNSAAVKKNRLFAGVNDSEIKLKFNPQNFLELKEGEIIYQKGEESNFIYLILEGEVKIKFIWTQEQRGVVRKYRDEFFGDDELLAKSMRRSSAVAMTGCLLYTINKKELEYMAALNKPMLNNLGLPETATDLYNFSEQTKIDLKTTTEKIGLYEPDVNIPSVEKIDVSPVEIPEVSSDIKLDSYPADYAELSIHPGINKEEFFKQELLDEPDDETSTKFADTVEQDKNDSIDSRPVETDETPEFDETEMKPSEEISIASGFDSGKNISESGESDFEIVIDDDLYIKIHSGLNIEDTLKSVVHAAKEVTKADRGIIFVSEEIQKKLGEVLSGNSLSNEIALPDSQDLSWTSFINGEVIINNNVISNDIISRRRELPGDYTILNTICYPLTTESTQIIAVLQLFNSGSGSFSGIDEKKLSALSKHFISSITRSLTFDDLLTDKRLSTLKDISGFLVSDIKAPILTIKHYASLLKKQNFSAEANSILDMLIHQANSVTDLAETTLDFVYNRTPVTTEIRSLNSVIDEILILLSDYVELRNVKLFKKIETTAKVEIDRKAMYQVCFQLIKNSCDAMSSGGNIFITCSSDEDFAKIDIRDEGPGVPVNIKENLFDMFVTYGKPGAAGIGLALTKKIINELNGTISVQSNRGEGTTFIILLPVAKD